MAVDSSSPITSLLGASSAWPKPLDFPSPGHSLLQAYRLGRDCRLVSSRPLTSLLPAGRSANRCRPRDWLLLISPYHLSSINSALPAAERYSIWLATVTVASIINDQPPRLISDVGVHDPLLLPPSSPTPITTDIFPPQSTRCMFHSPRFSLRPFHADLHPNMHRKLAFLSVFPLVNLSFILFLIPVSSLSRRYGVAPRSIRADS